MAAVYVQCAENTSGKRVAKVHANYGSKTHHRDFGRVVYMMLAPMFLCTNQHWVGDVVNTTQVTVTTHDLLLVLN